MRPNPFLIHTPTGRVCYLAASFRGMANVYLLETGEWAPCRLSDLRPIGGAR